MTALPHALAYGGDTHDPESMRIKLLLHELNAQFAPSSTTSGGTI